MTRRTQCPNIMIIYLLIGYLFQTGHGAATSADAAVDVSVDAAGGGGAAAANNAIGNAGAQLSTLLKETGATVKDFGSETTKAAEEMMRATGRASLAFGFVLNQLLRGLSATTATGTELLANGATMVDGALSGVPVVRVITAGLRNVASELATTVGEVSQNARDSRHRLIQTLREYLDGADAGANGGAAVSVDAGATADVAADAGSG